MTSETPAAVNGTTRQRISYNTEFLKENTTARSKKATKHAPNLDPPTTKPSSRDTNEIRNTTSLTHAFGKSCNAVLHINMPHCYGPVLTNASQRLVVPIYGTSGTAREPTEI
jgi:hypothetical protein